MSNTKIQRVIWAGYVTEHLQPVVDGLTARGCRVEFLLPRSVTCAAELTDERLEAALDGLTARMDRADMVILAMTDLSLRDSATICDGMDEEQLRRTYRAECLIPLRILNRVMPLLEKGEGRRIGAVVCRGDSHACCREASGFGRHMAGAALRLALRELFNELHPDGYTFRLYAQEPGANDAYAAEYFTRARSWEREDPEHSDENRFVIHDANGFEVPW